jgi:nucleoside-diphosphate-sugar epimerase
MTTLAGQNFVILGCGYVGSALARAALSRGATVSALTRNEAKIAELRALGINAVRGELAGHGWHAALSSNGAIVVNTVSAADPTPAGYRRSYVDGMRSILAWTRATGGSMAAFIYTSSTGVYAQNGGVRVDEESPTNPSSPTGRILLEAEALIRSEAQACCRRWFILRLAGIYGPGRHHYLDALRAGTTHFSGAPDFRLNLAHRDDIVAAILACAAAPVGIANEVFNVSDGASATRREVVEWLAARLHAPAPSFAVAAGGSARRGGGLSPDRVIASDKLRRVLGWTPRYSDYRAGYEALLGEV